MKTIDPSGSVIKGPADNSTGTTNKQRNGQTGTVSEHTDTASRQTVLWLDRRMDRRVLQVDKRILWLDKWVLRVGQEHYQ